MYYNPTLDGLRAIAIIFVFIGHIFQNHLPMAWTGVEIFLILSGYLITGTLLYNSNYIDFFKRRALRILPALFLFIIFFLIFSCIFSISASERFIFSAIFFFSNWLLALGIEPANSLTHLWSLALEEQFYLFFPFLLVLFFRYPKILIIFFSVFFIYKFHMFQVGFSFDRLYYGTDTRMASFFLGAILYFINIGKFKFKFKKYSFISILPLLSLLFISFLEINIGVFYWAFLSNLWVALIILSSGGKDLIVNKILSFYPLCWVGRISFGLYLWHYPIFKYLSENYSISMVFFVGVPLTFIFASISYYYVEKPLIRRYKKVI